MNSVQTSKPIYEVIAEEVKKAEADGAHVTRLDIGSPLHDYRIVETVRRGLIDRLSQKDWAHKTISKYPSNTDPEDFRQAVVKHIKEAYGYKTNIDEISGIEGAHKGVFIALMAFNKPGESRVLVPVPGYPQYEQALKALNLKDKAIPINEQGTIDFEQLKKILENKKEPISSILLIYPQNPTGAVLSEKERTEIIALCRKYNVTIINDYPYGNLDFSAKPCKPFAATDKDIAIDIFSLSKTGSIPGLRIGFVNSSKEKIAMFNKTRWAVSHGTSPFHIEAAKLALPKMQQCIERLSKRYARGLELAKNILSKFTDTIAQGAMYFWLKIPKSFKALSDDRSMDFTKHLIQEARVSSIPGSAFGDKDHVRLALVEKPRQLESALKRVAQAL